MNNHRALFVGTISELNRFLLTGDAKELLAQRFFDVWGHLPSAQEAQSWMSSLPALTSLLVEQGLGELLISAEYPLPSGFGRCDVVLLAELPTGMAAHVVELKQWSESGVELPRNDRMSVRVCGDRTVHPSYQTANYVGKIRSFHSLGSNMTVSGSVYMHNLTGQQLDRTLRCAQFEDVTAVAPVFGHDEGALLQTHLVEALGGRGCDIADALRFLKGTYKPAKDLLDMVREHAETISSDATELLRAGWGLSGDQHEIEEDVMAIVRDGQRKVISVSGTKGAGKTLLAVRLLLRALFEGRTVALTTQNGRLVSVLRKTLDDVRPHLSGFVHLPENVPALDQPFDLLICDEGQRLLKRQISKLVARSSTSIFLYDEDQRLLIKEEGTRDAFIEVGRRAGRPHVEFRLKNTHRSLGGEQYHAQIVQLLYPTGAFSMKDSGCDLRVFENPRDLVKALQHQRDHGGYDVALVASFTESDGRSSTIRLAEPRIDWVMTSSEYVDFWLRKGSNRLDRCASVFGAQSFERDYVGVLWGRDLVVRDGKWTYHPEHALTIKDDIGSPTLSQLITDRKRPDEAIRLLKHRYEILLTRGKKGTYICFEDPETAQYVLTKRSEVFDAA